MKALVYLLGAHALTVAHERAARPQTPKAEAELAPMVTTAETAGAWRRWADAGRTPAARAARPKPAPTSTGAPRLSTGGAHV